MVGAECRCLLRLFLSAVLIVGAIYNLREADARILVAEAACGCRQAREARNRRQLQPNFFQADVTVERGLRYNLG